MQNRSGLRQFVDHQSRSDIAIGGGDERVERQFVDSSSLYQFHMSHVAAGAFQKQCAIRQTSTVEETNVDVGGKDANVRKRGVANARSGQTVVHEFSHVGPQRRIRANHGFARARMSSGCAASQAAIAGSRLTDWVKRRSHTVTTPAVFGSDALASNRPSFHICLVQP